MQAHITLFVNDIVSNPNLDKILVLALLNLLS